MAVADAAMAECLIFNEENKNKEEGI